MNYILSVLSLFGLTNAVILSMSPIPTPSPSSSCVPKKWFVDANGDGLIDVDGAQWYGWFDVDNPSGDGDFENIGYLNSRYAWSLSSELNFCTFPIDIECVTVDSDIPWKDLGLTIRYNRHWGCECLNSENNFACVDLKVKYLCPPSGSEAYYGCNPPANYIPEGSDLGSVSTTSTQPPTQTVSQTSSQTLTPTPTTTASCVPQLYFLDADHDGLIDIANAQWYGWYSIDGPEGMGEYEHIDYVNGDPGAILTDLSFCPRPLDVQCVEINSETPWDQLDLNIHFDSHFGCWCINSENTNACVNMKIKYLCPPQTEQAYFGCSPPVDYIPATNPLASYSNTITNTGTATLTPTYTSTSTGTCSISPSSNLSNTPSNTPTSSFILSLSYTETPTNTLVPSFIPSSSNTLTPSPSLQIISVSPILQNESPSSIPSTPFEVSPNPSSLLNGTFREEDSRAAITPSGASPGEVAGFTFLGLILAAAAIGLLVLANRKKQQKKNQSLPISAPIKPNKNLIFEQNPMMNQTQNPMLRPMSINPLGEIDKADALKTKYEKVAFSQLKINK